MLKSIAAEFARLDAEIAALRAQIATNIVAPPHSAAPAVAAFDADQSFSGAEGFYKLEHDAMGVAYRWTGPHPSFSFRFALDRSRPAEVKLNFDKLFADGPLDGLTCDADGQAIALEVEKAERGFVARGILPARALDGETLLRFTCPAMDTPRAHGHDDDRVLGLSFRQLHVVCLEDAAEAESVAAS